MPVDLQQLEITMPQSSGVRSFSLRGTVMILVFVSLCLLRLSAEDPPSESSANSPTTIVELGGTVQISLSGSAEWRSAAINQILKPGDRIRTLVESRATIRLSDRSVIRLNQSTLVEIQAPTQPTARKRFRLRSGKLFFLNREKPSDIEFETPLATGAIRGTEFLLEVSETDGSTRLTVLDGEVDLQSGDEFTTMTDGEQALIRPGAQIKKSPVLMAVNLMQWALYYPGVLDLKDIGIERTAPVLWSASIEAYRSGDMPNATALLPRGVVPATEAERGYLAALRLAVGQAEETETLVASLAPDSAVGNALREIVAAVKFQPWLSPRAPATGSEWLSHSYYLQSRSELDASLRAARKAVELSPGFGFAWVRVAELEFGFEHLSRAQDALREGLRLSPRNAQAISLQGYLILAENKPAAAEKQFEIAQQMDGAFANAWVGRALCLQQLGRPDEARQELEVAAALEPQRAILRSYLGKAWGQAKEDALAVKDFNFAKRLDPADPTAWLYSALHRHQINQFNAAVRDLEQSIDRNDNRSVFRSRLLLDRDRSIRSANLSALYDVVGLEEISERAASRSVQDDYANFSGHLFLARSLQNSDSPGQYDLRLETPRQSELLLANLLAPPGGGNLSQLLSQQDHLQYFDQREIGMSSLTEYSSVGDWNQAMTVFGQLHGLSYAVDGQYYSHNDRRVNNEQTTRRVSAQVKQQLTLADSAYLQIGYVATESGDLARYYDSRSAKPEFHVEEAQEPNLYFGFHHEWAPGSHTLLLAARIKDRLTLSDPQPNILFFRQAAGQTVGVETDPFFNLNLHSEFTLHTMELQHIFESEHHTFLFGGRYQIGSADTRSILTRTLPSPGADQSFTPDLERINAYACYTWHPIPRFHFTAGLSYDQLTYPLNVDIAPIRDGEARSSELSPKLGLSVSPWKDGYLRAAFSRSLGGLYFDNSVRLEPTQLEGFVTAYRSLIPESSAGLLAGADFETWGIGFDQQFKTGTYAGLAGEILKSNGQRTVGVFTNSTGIPIPDRASSTSQTLVFEERSFSVFVNQLLGDQFSTGARYRLSTALLSGRFPEVPSTASGLSQLTQDERSTLELLQLFFIWNHDSGVYAQWDSNWYRQSNRGYTPDRAGDSLWQHNLHVGYRFPHRRAEVRLGLLNLTDQDSRLNPLNWMATALPERRTVYMSLRLNF